ncbi:MAG: glycosyltransferase [Candidatus Rokuibacteriota bacterium]
MTDRWSVSVVIPVYNEASLIESTVLAVDAFLEQHFRDYEIVVIESGSTDGTGDICDRVARARVRVIHEGARNGFGSAVRLGWAHARKDLVWLVAPDVTFPLESILDALPFLDDHDCVLSYRSRDPRTAFRRLQSFVYNRLARLVLGLRVRHVNSSFKLLKRDVVARLPVRSSGWFLDTELVYRIEHEGVRYVEIPVELVERQAGRSSITPLTSVSVARELIAFLRQERSRRS